MIKEFIYWYNYFDDVLISFTGTIRRLQMFENFINALHPNVKVTTEMEQNNMINLLDR